MDKMFPQSGIITSLDTDNAQGKALIPLLRQETDWCPVATNLLYETNNVLSLNSPIVTESTQYKELSGKINKFGSLNVGDEVLVVFLNGDPHSPVIAARL